MSDGSDSDPASVIAAKRELRRRMRAMRRELLDRPERSARIVERLVALDAVASARRLLAYASIPGEVETAGLVDWCAARGIETAMPEDDVDATWPDVIIVPGTAFTTGGARIGQGGGWYDRFLPDRSSGTTLIGVAFAVQIVDSLPTEPHDVALDIVVTEDAVHVAADDGRNPMVSAAVVEHAGDVTESANDPWPAPLEITREEFDAAIATVRRHVPPTPQYEWPLLTEHAGSRVTVKHENHTPVGAFKVRGGLVYFERLASERPSIRGVVSATRGNHGQSLAFAGRAHGRDVTIFVPHGNSVEKNAAMRALGADVIEHGDDFQDAREASVVHADEHGLEAVPPFHRDLVLGVATYALELFDGADPLDTVYVPIGMGSGINAIIAVRDLLGLDTDVVGVVSDAAPASKLTFDTRTLTTTSSAATFVDGVATRAPDVQSMAGVLAGAARVISVSDDAVADAMRTIYRTTHNVAESAGAIALAGLLSEPADLRGVHSAFVLCGGNVDTDQFAAVLAGATPTV